jgi:hypothetical protein
MLLASSFFLVAPSNRVFITIPAWASDDVASLKRLLDSGVTLALTSTDRGKIAMPELDPFTPSGSTVRVSPTNGLAHNMIDNLEDGFRFERDDGAKLFREHNKVASLGVREAVAAYGSPNHF